MIPNALKCVERLEDQSEGDGGEETRVEYSCPPRTNLCSVEYNLPLRLNTFCKSGKRRV
jgi:hypothetical protein